METDLDLPGLIAKKDHLNILRFIRAHELREPELVVESGKKLLGDNLDRKPIDELARRAVLEQVCYSALDLSDSKTADGCLSMLRESGVEKESVRFRMCLARCLESDKDYEGATKIYDALLTDNPSNSLALKRKYCILKAQNLPCEEALNEYLELNYQDTGAWYEMAKIKQRLGDWKGSAFCLEEVLLQNSGSSKMHVELAESYATIGGDHLILARKHMAQALELDPSNVRAMFGLVYAANAYLSLKNADKFESQVAQELIKYGANKVNAVYKSLDPKLRAAVQGLMKEYTDDL